MVPFREIRRMASVGKQPLLDFREAWIWEVHTHEIPSWALAYSTQSGRMGGRLPAYYCKLLLECRKDQSSKVPSGHVTLSIVPDSAPKSRTNPVCFSYPLARLYLRRLHQSQPQS